MYSQPTFDCISLKISLISSLQSEILVRKKQSIIRLTALCIWIWNCQTEIYLFRLKYISNNNPSPETIDNIIPAVYQFISFAKNLLNSEAPKIMTMPIMNKIIHIFLLVILKPSFDFSKFKFAVFFISTLYHSHISTTIKFYAPIILLNSSNSTSFTPPALNTKPTAIKATTKKPISLENSRLNPK